MAAHLYWRINVTANDGDANYLAIAEVEMRATIGGADQCTGGTATASSFATGGEPALAVDNDTTSKWSTDLGTVTGWWQYQFASPVTVTEYRLFAHSVTPARSPKDFTLEYSDDGVAWTVADTRVGIVSWSASEIRTFVAPVGAASGAYSRWMLSIGANAGYSSFVALYEVQMRATVGGADQCTGGTATASSTDPSSLPSDAVDDNSATRWISGTTYESGWWQYEFASPVSVAEYTIQTSASSPTVAPSSWTLLGSNDGVDWYLADSQSGHVSWTSAEVKTFTPPAPPVTLPLKGDLQTLAFAYQGAPFVRVEAKDAITSENLGFAYQGAPFYAVDSGAGAPTSHTLTGDNATQPNTSTTGAITQEHVLGGADATQPNASSTGAISFPGVELAGDNATQPNTSTTGAITQTHVLAGDDATQPNASSTGAITQIHVLVADDASQPNTSTEGAISLGTLPVGPDGYVAVIVMIG